MRPTEARTWRLNHRRHRPWHEAAAVAGAAARARRERRRPCLPPPRTGRRCPPPRGSKACALHLRRLRLRRAAAMLSAPAPRPRRAQPRSTRQAWPRYAAAGSAGRWARRAAARLEGAVDGDHTRMCASSEHEAHKPAIGGERAERAQCGGAAHGRSVQVRVTQQRCAVMRA